MISLPSSSSERAPDDFQSKGPQAWKRASLDRHISTLNKAHEGAQANPMWIDWLRDNLPAAIANHVAACEILDEEPVATVEARGPIL